MTKLPHLAFDGIVACVPTDRVSNAELDFPGVDMARIIETTGIAYRRVAAPGTTTADYCQRAAEAIFADPASGVSADDIQVLVFVTQTPDYLVPSTAHLLQDKLGLPKSCIAIHITEGCSGYIYGLFVLSSMLRAFPGAKGMLLVGDTSTVGCNRKDKSTWPLFGDSGTATVVHHGDGEDSFMIGGDGDGYDDIIIPGVGYREGLTRESFDAHTEDGLTRRRVDLHLDGMNVFTFGIGRVPKLLKSHLAAEALDVQDIDYIVLHQANRMMLEGIRKKLKAAPEQVPYSLHDYGNTSSATVPITMVANLRDELMGGGRKYLLSGFGVGLSWGSLITTISDVKVAKVIEFDGKSF